VVQQTKAWIAGLFRFVLLIVIHFFDAQMNQGYVREHARQLLGIRPEDLPEQWFSADPVLAQEINGRPLGSVTPAELKEALQSYLKIDWNHGGLTNWTKHMAAIFESRFLSEHRLGSFHLLKRSCKPGEISQMFIRFVLHLKSVYALAAGKKSFISEAKAKQKSRKRSRRKQV
jgi:hypothetical protein